MSYPCEPLSNVVRGELPVRGFRLDSGLSHFGFGLCGLGCFAGGQLAPLFFVGCYVIGLEIKECVVL